MRPVTDPQLLAQLEGGAAVPRVLKPVTDPALLAQLEGPQPLPTDVPEPELSTPEAFDLELRGYVQPVGRAIGRTVRAGALGITAIPNMIGDALGLRSSESVRQALDTFLPKPENAAERIAEDVAAGMAGAGGIVKAGQAMSKAATPLVQRIGELLATAPGVQVTSGATGPGAASVVREEGGGPGAQLAAGVAGAAVPALGTAARATVRGMMRGGEAGRQRVADTIETFEEAGAGTPTVGQATGTRLTRAVESALSKAPGSACRMVSKAEAESAGMGAKVDAMASRLAPRTGAEPAGRAIKAGIDDFVKEFRVSSSKLYDELDKYIPKDKQVSVDRTKAALEGLNADIPGAPNLSEWFKNAKIQGIERALVADTSGAAAANQNMPIFQLAMLKTLPMTDAERKAALTAFSDGKLPYEALKKLRTLVGNEMATPSLVSDVPRSKWQALYAALSEDLAAAAKEGGRRAERSFGRANKFYASGMKRVEDVLQPIVSKADPEDIFRAAVSGTKEGATTIRGVMKSIPGESQKVLSATMLRRLGRATPGQQNELGEAFSAETFLTNWNRVAPEAKKALFSPMTPAMRKDLDQIAAAAANMREGSKVFSNPSGTAQAMTNIGAGGLFIGLLIGGNVPGAAGVAGTVVSSNLAARLMTNPEFVRFLAGSTRVPVEQVPAQLNQLFQQTMHLKRDERRDVREFIKTARETLQSQRAPESQ